MTHETAIAAGVIKEAEKHGIIKAITLEIGELAHVPGQELVSYMQQLRPHWTITWKEIPSTVVCDCGFRGHPIVLERGHDFFMIECPECHITPTLIGGTEVKLVSVKI